MEHVTVDLHLQKIIHVIASAFSTGWLLMSIYRLVLGVVEGSIPRMRGAIKT